jgi:hypothetical protein
LRRRHKRRREKLFKTANVGCDFMMHNVGGSL